MSTFTLARLHSVQHDNPSIVCRSELRCDRDPALPVRPGGQIDCEWILTPQGEGARFYGYLMADSFTRVATMENLAGLSLLPSGDRYATSTTPGVERIAKFTLRVNAYVPSDAFLVPVLRAGIIADGGKGLTSTTFSLKDRGFRIAALPPQGRSMLLLPGHRGVLKGLADGLGGGRTAHRRRPRPPRSHRGRAGRIGGLRPVPRPPGVRLVRLRPRPGHRRPRTGTGYRPRR
ncbi:hypothetical protein [Streptomyces microflavus]|uniref:hypothetical protein n=1 Tax=Streptomyces microflavus TaxID=1919 RepID=UPI003B21A075